MNEYPLGKIQEVLEGSSENNKSYIHLHAFEIHHYLIEMHLLFRDYLRSNPEVIRRYEQFKFHLVNECGVSRYEYSDPKTHFISEVLNLTAHDQFSIEELI